MTKAELEQYAEKFEATGLHFAKSMGHKGNLTHLEDIPWDQAIVIIMSLKGWRITEESEAKVIPLRLET